MFSGFNNIKIFKNVKVKDMKKVQKFLDIAFIICLFCLSAYYIVVSIKKIQTPVWLDILLPIIMAFITVWNARDLFFSKNLKDKNTDS
jgi:uncharacterized protein with PQ loop repeat